MNAFAPEFVDCINQTFEVAFSYPVYFTRRLFADDNPLFPSFFDRRNDTGAPARVLIGLDAGLVKARPGLDHEVMRFFASRPSHFEVPGPPLMITGGEAAKHHERSVRRILKRAAKTGLCRHSYLVAVGGGSMLDLAGLAAALIHRGVRLIRVPTTVLAQCDGGVGVKNGMDAFRMKNFIGAFAPPFAVFNDLDMLDTLPDAYWFGGIAEAFKVAIIRDREFFEELVRLTPGLRVRRADAIEPVVRQTARLHLAHIREGGDPFEFGSARPLDFGHWAAHKIETLSGYRIGHGQAVAAGMALDICYAAQTGLLATEARDTMLAAMQDAGLTLWLPWMDQRDAYGEPVLLAGLDEFRQHLGGRLSITLPLEIGRAREVHDIARPALIKAMDVLRHAAAGGWA